MGLLLSVNHLFNFLLPALVLALFMPLLGRWTGSPASWPQGWWRQCLLHLVLGMAVLLAGLWIGGRDGMVATYGALVLTAATVQWLLGMRRAA